MYIECIKASPQRLNQGDLGLKIAFSRKNPETLPTIDLCLNIDSTAVKQIGLELNNRKKTSAYFVIV